MAPTNEMRKICKTLSPFACCIVPEKRSELTTEGGLDVKNNLSNLESILFLNSEHVFFVKLSKSICSGIIFFSKTFLKTM